MIPLALIIKATISIVIELFKIEEQKTMEGKVDFVAKQLEELFPDVKLEIKDVEDLVDFVIVNKLHVEE